MKIWVTSQDGRKMLLTGEFIISSYLVDVYEIIDLIKSRTIPPEDLTNIAIKTYSYEVLLKLKDELELLLLLLDINKFWNFIKSDKAMLMEFKCYKRIIKRTYPKVLRLIKKRKKNLPVVVQKLIDEFGGTIEDGD